MVRSGVFVLQTLSSFVADKMKGKSVARDMPRRCKATASAPAGSPPLVTMRKAKERRIACDLNETIDEDEWGTVLEGRQAVMLAERNVDDEALQRASDEPGQQETTKDKSPGGKAAKSTKGKLKRTASARAREEKENNCTTPQRVRKRQKREPLVPLVHQEHSTQESPPIFAFKQGKTSLKIRKLRKEQQNHLGKQKRLDELVAYFYSLDNERLDFL